MNHISFNRRFLIGLSAYLLRLGLSVDRTLRQSTGPLKGYCEGTAIPTLSQVLASLDSMCAADGADEPMQESADATHNGVLPLVTAWLGWCFRGRVVFKKSEVRFIHSVLLQLSTELHRCPTVDPEVFGPIRVRLTSAYLLCFARIPDRHARSKINRVEHLNQNPRLKTETIDSICGHRDWLI